MRNLQRVQSAFPALNSACCIKHTPISAGQTAPVHDGSNAGPFVALTPGDLGEKQRILLFGPLVLAQIRVQRLAVSFRAGIIRAT